MTQQSLDGFFSGDFSSHTDWYQRTLPSKPKTQPQAGRVTLVGAGPCDPELLTLKALKAIQQADVVIYDRLVGRDILEFADPDAEMIYVGKRCGRPSMSQESINAELVRKAKAGKQVVRLKGGDPFVFGRGGEEALALVSANVAYQVIPGITAALGCAASSLIPLTHREVSRSVTLVTGQVVTGSLPAWAELVASGQTLVFYMGLEKAAQIQHGLMAHGLSSSTPVAIIGKGCSATQEVHTLSLETLEKHALELKGLSPALIILGDVVKLRAALLHNAELLQSVQEDV